MTRLRFSRLALLSVCLMAAAGCGSGGCLYSAPVGVDGANSQPARETPQSADPSAPPARAKVVFLGDSLTIGFGLLESQSYPALIQARMDEDGYAFEVVNAGVSGDTSAGGLRRLDWALEGNVGVLVLALGANDGLRGLSIAEMKQNLHTIIERARARNIVVILAGMEAPPNYGPEYTLSFRSAFRDVASSDRVLFIPFLLDKVAGVGALNQADGIHPNADGARIVADTVWPVLRSVLDQMAGSQ
jgi:acyl-CoA thioesterase-1